MARRAPTEVFGTDLGAEIGEGFLGQLPRGSIVRTRDMRDPDNSSRRIPHYQETYTFQGFYEQKILRDSDGVPRSTPVITILAISIQPGVRTSFVAGGSDFSDDFSDDFGGTGMAEARTEAVDTTPEVGDVIQMVGNPTEYRITGVNIPAGEGTYECVCAL